MSLRSRIIDRGRQLVQSPAVMRFVSDDRVMRAAEGVLDAKTRFRLAWHMLKNGHALPAVDPALDDSLGETISAESSYGHSNGHSQGNGSQLGTNGSSHAASDYAVSASSSSHASAVHGARSGKNGSGGGNGALGMESVEVEATSAAARRRRQNGVQLLDKSGMEDALKERTSLANVGGRDVFEKAYQFTAADNARKAGLYPFFRPLDLNDGPEAVIDGRRVLMFGSNNYLGLTTHPKVREAAKAAIDRFGTSMTGSRLVNGSMKLHNEFEEKLAAYFGKESALVFTTGYQANLATCAALLSNKASVAVVDRNVHASLYDGVRLGQAAGARLTRFKHADAESLDRALQRVDAGEGALVITDGVFSAEGEIAKLDELVPVVKKHGARLLVDDAHALGVIGPGGRGTAYLYGLEKDVDLITGTFSKSLASIGGWIVGERKVLQYIQHFAPSFMFAASAAPPSVAAAMAAFDLMQEEPWRIDRLRENFTYMRDELTRMGFELGHTQTAVIPIYIRQDLRTLMMWRELLEEHSVYTNPFISPGVPPKSAMLRTSYMATHTREHLDRGLEALQKTGKKYGVI
ncbi:MAG TPA: aminotransferase class I/II-fold pyridoxal phosphate-dependent enzyme [Polyangiaceae bacterium]|nr:aminotransferase class I/II-fold pyridoxal phosphate-dependent enzyme [Polyangiaceae bacterium]